MRVVVSYDLSFAEETFAFRAAQKPILLVHLHVCFPVWDLIEAHWASFCRALKRFFPCMDPQMVKKIVPLTEQLLALRIVTCKRCWLPLGSGTLVRYQGEGLGLWNVLFAKELWIINVFAMIDFDWFIRLEMVLDHHSLFQRSSHLAYPFVEFHRVCFLVEIISADYRTWLSYSLYFPIFLLRLYLKF